MASSRVCRCSGSDSSYCFRTVHSSRLAVQWKFTFPHGAATRRHGRLAADRVNVIDAMGCTRFAYLMELAAFGQVRRTVSALAAILSLLTYREHVVELECVQQKIPLFLLLSARCVSATLVIRRRSLHAVLPASSTERMLQLPRAHFQRTTRLTCGHFQRTTTLLQEG